MARLDPRPYPIEKRWTDRADDDVGCKWPLEELMKQDEAVWRTLQAEAAALPAGGIVGAVLTFPVGDGRAIYRVTKAKPLTLQHVPLGDAYTIPAAHLRGITADDVRAEIARSKTLAKLFGRKGGKP